MSLPFIPFANCAEVVMEFSLASQKCFLTNGVRKSAPFYNPDLEDIGDLFIDWATDHLLTHLNSGISLTQVKVTDLTAVDAPVVYRAGGLPVAGTVVGAIAPNNVAACVSYGTTARGRSYRGRNYVCGMSSGDLSSSTLWSNATLTWLIGDYLQLAADINGAGFNHVVLSRYNNLTRRTTGVATQINSYTARPEIATQRRRVAGVGV